MKRMKKFPKVLVLTLMFMLTMTTTCFADVYFSPMWRLADYLVYYDIIYILLGVALLIALCCALVGKLNGTEELLRKSLSVSESLLYYLLAAICMGIALWASISIFFIVAIIPFMMTLVSIGFRVLSKNKKASYGLLAVIFIFVVAMALSSLVRFY